jgi:hypothetical protein
MNNQNVKPMETTFVMTHALRSCRRKVFKKGAGFATDKLTTDERDQFTNCLGKYIDVTNFSNDSLREGLLQSL